MLEDSVEGLVKRLEQKGKKIKIIDEDGETTMKAADYQDDHKRFQDRIMGKYNEQ